MSRTAIRNQIRSARRAVPEVDRAAWSQSICERIIELPLFQSAKRIAAFLAFDGEADPMAAMLAAASQPKRVYVPTIIAKGKPLMFVPWAPGCEMQKNYFGIEEPAAPKSEWIEGRELDFVITPLVAFDESCNRIGVGGGYYDRTFEFLNLKPKVDLKNIQVSDVEVSIARESSTCLFGFAFELQKVDAISTNDWDVQLHGVATEKNSYPIA